MTTRMKFPTRQAERKKNAEERNEKFAKLTTEQKIQHLDKMNGKGVGASRQRKKYNS